MYCKTVKYKECNNKTKTKKEKNEDDSNEGHNFTAANSEGRVLCFESPGERVGS